MSTVLFVSLLAMCGATILWALGAAERLYLYPVLCALVVLGWVVPQLLLLLDFPDLPEGALPLTMTMILLSFAGILWGWKRGAHAMPSLPALAFDDRRLLLGAIALSLFGAYFRLAIRGLPAELLEMSNWSGPQTIYIFFAGTQILSMALGWLLFLRSGSLLGLAVAAFNFLFFLDAIVIGGRRGVIVEVGFVLLVGVWLAKRWAPPRLALTVGVLGLTILFNVIGEYRAATSARTVYTDRISFTEAWENIRQIDFVEGFMRTIAERDPRMLELYNTTLIIGGTQQQLDFEGLANYWNRIVFGYVPGQIVGFDIKQSLMFATVDPMIEVYGQTRANGTVHTGFADAFRSFWLFGALVFFGFAWLMRLCWDRAIDGQLLFQFLYLVLMKEALHAITHTTSWFVAYWPFVAVFAGPVFWFARRRTAIHAPQRRRPPPTRFMRRRAIIPVKRLPAGREGD